MRPTPFLLKGRGPFYERTIKIPMKENFNLALSNELSKNSSFNNERPCVAEIGIVLQCFKDHDFQESRCVDALSKLQKCYSQHVAQLKENEEEQTTMKPGTSSRKMPISQINKLLKKYPTK